MNENIDTHGAVDLSQVEALAAARQAVAEQQAQTQAQVDILRWDRAMTRAFKGIFPRSQRMAWLKREHARQMREQG